MFGKNRILTSFLFAALLFPGFGNASEPVAKTITHVVIAWLKPEFRTEEYINKLLQANERLREIPQVQSLQTGTARKSERKMVDDSFDFGNAMTFNSKQDMQDYLVHPIHVEFIDTYIKGKAEKVTVFDF
jgi:Stress responsive A/B Barrel Domain